VEGGEHHVAGERGLDGSACTRRKPMSE
jgi:hypothetical protein